MGFDHGFIDAPFDTAEGDAEQAAHHQRSLDVLYRAGCALMDDALTHELCNVCGISFAELQTYRGKS